MITWSQETGFDVVGPQSHRLAALLKGKDELHLTDKLCQGKVCESLTCYYPAVCSLDLQAVGTIISH